MRKKQDVRNKAIAYIAETHGFSFSSFGKLNKARAGKKNTWESIHCNTHIHFFTLIVYFWLFYYFVCMCLGLHKCLCIVCVKHPQRPEEGVKSLET